MLRKTSDRQCYEVVAAVRDALLYHLEEKKNNSGLLLKNPFGPVIYSLLLLSSKDIVA